MNEDQIQIAIAKALGWKWKPDPNCVHPSKTHWWYPFPNHTDPILRDFNGQLPNWPTEASQAVTLCDVLADEGWHCGMNNGLDKSWECIFSQRPDTVTPQEGDHYGAGKTMALAICEAFLRVRNAWDEEATLGDIRAARLGEP